MTSRETALVGALVLLATAVQLVVLDPRVLHVDEALYAAYGVHIATSHDWLLLHTAMPLDKTPGFFWVLGATLWLVGNSAMALRLPNLIFAAITLVSLYAVARQLGGQRAALLAALLWCLSPFGALFGATVFVDPMAVALAMASLAMAVHRRPGVAGLMLAAAVAGKVFAFAFIPLGLALVWLTGRERRGRDLLEYSVALGCGIPSWA